MLISTLLLVTKLLAGASAAPADSNRLLDTEVYVGDTSENSGSALSLFPEASLSDDSSESSEKGSITPDNDFKVPHDYRKYRVLEVGIDRTRLGTDPVLCNPTSNANDPDACEISDASSSKGSNKRSFFQSLSTRALSSDKKEALRLHNDARSKKKVKALVWDTKLEADANAWAKKIAKAAKMQHSQGKDRVNQGENLAYAWSSGGYKNPITDAARSWLNEAKHYKGEVIPKGNFSDYGHYTQCVWKSTTKIGIAAAQDSKGGWYTVARYQAPGNVVGQKAY
ncbi:hypothetical protein F66182_8769 [Fusarium sp. NRRL 66182]|nr:hypothetical protein F66182_8769 [Fusarium sp. NRRL 66182]